MKTSMSSFDMETSVIWTVGHSNRLMAELIGLLTEQSISVLADVRRFPGSKRQPQFAKDSLESSLRAAGIGYRHFEALGGRRSRSREDSPNTAWRSASFSAYADHMQTAEFQAALAELMVLAASSQTAILCAEVLPWRCHRQAHRRRPSRPRMRRAAHLGSEKRATTPFDGICQGCSGAGDLPRPNE